MCREVRIEPTQQGQGTGQLSEARDGARPPDVPRDFEEGIRAAQSLARGGDQMHLGEQFVRGHAKAFGSARCLQGQESEAASGQEAFHSGRQSRAEGTTGIEENPT